MLNKFRTPDIVLGAVLSALVWAGIWGWSDSYAPSERQKQECYDAAKAGGHKTEECKSVWERTTSDPVALYTFGVFIFTMVLGVSTIFLWSVTRKAANAAEIAADAAKNSADAAVATERARFYLVEGENNFMELMNIVEHWSGPIDGRAAAVGVRSIKISFKNYGKTPALFQAVCYGLKFSREPFDFICSPENKDEEIVEPGNTVGPFSCVLESETLTNREAIEIYRGTGHLWLYGRLYYKDVFENPHVHRFYRRFTRLSQYRYGLRSYEYKDFNEST